MEENVFQKRLKQARVMRGLSMEALCAKTGGRLSKQSISKYEKGKMMPDSTSLIVLSSALDLPVDYFFRPFTVSIDSVEFRKKSKLGAKQVDQIREKVKDRLERYCEIEEVSDIAPGFSRPCAGMEVRDADGVCDFVERVKAEWKLGDNGISNVIETIEENGIKVIEIDAPKSFDGLSGFADGSSPFIVLNCNFDSERKRFTALHELGHILMPFADCVDGKERERLCNLFASEMLISRGVFIQKIGERRKDISLRELADLQVQFGVSVDALVYKAMFLGVITASRHKSFCIRKNADKPFRTAVEKSRIRAERSRRFERLVYRAVADELISVSKAGALLGEPLDSVRNNLSLVFSSWDIPNAATLAAMAEARSEKMRDAPELDLSSIDAMEKSMLLG